MKEVGQNLESVDIDEGNEATLTVPKNMISSEVEESGEIHEKSQVSTSEKWRVKLYELDAKGSWIDRGTGFCSSVTSVTSVTSVKSQGKDSGTFKRRVSCHIIVEDEESGDVLLRSLIRPDVYERQGGNIIMWREPGSNSYDEDTRSGQQNFYEDGTDYALSFKKLKVLNVYGVPFLK